MAFAIPALLVVAWLPGAAFFRIPVLDRDRRAALDAEERLFWAIVLSVAWSSMVVLALAAVNRYTLGRLLAIDVGMIVCVGLVCRRRLLFEGRARRASRTLLLPLALAVLGCWLFFPPFEHVIGGKDPGVYVAEGIQIAKRGAIVLRDPVVSTLPSQLRDLFFPFSRNAEFYSNRFMGFTVLDPQRGTVVGQFFHFYPAWIAIAYGLDGVRGALATTPVAAILGLLAVYFAGARLIGRGAALVGSVLLASNVATIWFAREPNSEVVSQALIFAALLALARSHVDGDRFFAPVAGVLLGLLLFLRLDGPVAVAAVAVGLSLGLLERRRPSLLFITPLVALGAIAVAYWTTWMKAYVMMPRLAAMGDKGLQLSTVGLPACGVLAVVGLIVVSRFERVAAHVRRVAPRLLAVAVLGTATYAYYFRVESHVPGGIAWCDARSLEIFTWYFPPIALLVALAGFAAVSWRSFWRAPALVVTLTLYAFFVFYKVRVVPDHFWMARRFVPVILPGACLMAGAGLWLVMAPARRPAGTADGPARRGIVRWAGVPVAVALAALIAAKLVAADRPIFDHVEYAGVTARLEALASRFGPEDLVVFNPRDPSTDVHVLALPLDYIWDRPAVVLPTPRPDKALFAQFLDWARHRYRHVYFLGSGGTDLVSRSIAAVPVFSDRFQVAEYESRHNALPQPPARRKEFDFGVYRFTNPGDMSASFELDLGRLDDLNVYRFHAKEQSEGTTFRWTRNASYIAVPPLAAMHTLTLFMADGGRPTKAEPARVTVYLNDRALGTVVVKGGYAPYAFSMTPDVVPADAGTKEASTVKLESTTWKPRDVLGTADDRDLGVMLRRIEIK